MKRPPPADAAPGRRRQGRARRPQIPPQARRDIETPADDDKLEERHAWKADAELSAASGKWSIEYLTAMLQSGPRQYGVQRVARQPLVDFMADALTNDGCRIIHVSDASVAPFVLTFETGAGERMGIVAYAFLATRTPTKNRPPDERSFQIKYGSKDGCLHELWQDPLGIYTTLLVGIDVEEKFFLAADPQLHSPTRFFIRLEFQDRHAAAIKKDGWHAWERESRGPRQLIVSERLFDYETLVGGTAGSFLDLVRFERAALGLSPGDRQLLAERRLYYADRAGMPSNDIHPLATEFELAPDQILELIAGARRLKMAVRGWVAEEKLREALSLIEGVSQCERLDEEGGPDLHLRWKLGPPLLIECKNVLRKRNAAGFAKIDFQRTRASKADPCSRYYAASDFHVVAGCLHAVSELWEFRYVTTAALPPKVNCPGKLDNNLAVDSRWTAQAGAAFDAAYAALRAR